MYSISREHNTEHQKNELNRETKRTNRESTEEGESTHFI